jgi:dTDP-4-amino-4,6-dideoxygalactose transaminase
MIPFSKPFIAGKELFYVAQAVMSGQLAGDALFTTLCEKWLEKHFSAPKVLLTPSGTAALELAALLLNLQPGDEVIVPSFTFVTTASAFALRGVIPVFVDIREDTFNLDETLVEKAITPRTRAIIAVHYAGCACELDVLRAIADKHGLALVEDAAHALGSSWRGKPLGSFGDLSCISFHDTKNIIAGEGGALVINRPELIDKAMTIRQKGTDRHRFLAGLTDKYTWVELGSSYVASELVAAFLWGQLEQFNAITSTRRRLWHAYQKALRSSESVEHLQLQSIPDECEINGHIFAVLAPSQEDRGRLLEHLKNNGINALFHYVPLHSSPAGRRLGRSHSSLDITNDISERLIRLPLYYELTDADQERVLSSLFSWGI